MTSTSRLFKKPSAYPVLALPMIFLFLLGLLELGSGLSADGSSKTAFQQIAALNTQLIGTVLIFTSIISLILLYCRYEEEKREQMQIELSRQLLRAYGHEPLA